MLVSKVSPLKFLARSSTEPDQGTAFASFREAQLKLKRNSLHLCHWRRFCDLQATSSRFGLHLNVVNLKITQLSSHAVGAR